MGIARDGCRYAIIDERACALTTVRLGIFEQLFGHQRNYHASGLHAVPIPHALFNRLGKQLDTLGRNIQQTHVGDYAMGGDLLRTLDPALHRLGLLQNVGQS